MLEVKDTRQTGAIANRPNPRSLSARLGILPCLHDRQESGLHKELESWRSLNPGGVALAVLSTRARVDKRIPDYDPLLLPGKELSQPIRSI